MNQIFQAFAGRRITRALVLAAPLLATAPVAQSAVVTLYNSATPAAAVGNLQESPYGLPGTMGGSVSMIDLTGKVGANNFTLTPAGGGTITVNGANISNAGATTTSSPVVQGSATGYAAPVTNASGATMTTPYFSTGANPGTIELLFSNAEKYLGFLWGSIDTINTLSFYSGSTLVTTVTGTQAQQAGPGFTTNGSQSFGGSQYVLINFLNGFTFNRVVLSEAQQNPNLPSFEAGLFQYSATNQVPLPEPASVALVGIGAAALVLGRRKAKAAKQA